MTLDSLTPYGLAPRWKALFAESATGAAELARVLRQDRGFVVVTTGERQIQVAVKTRHTGPVVVGDWVVIDSDSVTRVLERESLLTRQDPHSETEQALVANVDLVLIVCGADRPVNARRIERAVTQTWESGADPLVVLTKADLTDRAGALAATLREQVTNLDVIAVSSYDGNGLNELRKRMMDRTSVAFGESGAGKSTLVNALLDADVVSVGAVRERDSKGRHTTVRRELHLLPGGGSLIDTPGVRALGLWAEVESVDATFPDIAEIADQCRFSDCAHESEPGCAILAAIADGEIEVDRVNAWKTLTCEVESAEKRKTEQDKRKSDRKFPKR